MDCQHLRTGILFKKGSGMGCFGRRNWKPRYFVLTSHKLHYFKYENGPLRGSVDLSGCDGPESIEVMPTDCMKTGNSAATIWRVAVNTSARRLVLAASSEYEMNSWVEALYLACQLRHDPNGEVDPKASLRAKQSAKPCGRSASMMDLRLLDRRNSAPDWVSVASTCSSRGSGDGDEEPVGQQSLYLELATQRSSVPEFRDFQQFATNPRSCRSKATRAFVLGTFGLETKRIVRPSKAKKRRSSITGPIVSSTAATEPAEPADPAEPVALVDSEHQSVASVSEPIQAVA